MAQRILRREDEIWVNMDSPEDRRRSLTSAVSPSDQLSKEFSLYPGRTSLIPQVNMLKKNSTEKVRTIYRMKESFGAARCKEYCGEEAERILR